MTPSPLMILVGGELLLAFFILTIILTVVLISSGKRRRKAIRAFIVKVKESEKDRVAKIHKVLSEYGYPEEEQEGEAKELLKAETLFFKRLIKAVMLKQAEDMTDMLEHTDTVLESYRLLMPKGTVVTAAAAGEATEAAGDDSGQLKILQQDNERLKNELGITMDTLSKILSEYAFMYGGGGGDSEDEQVAELAKLTPDRLLAMLRGAPDPTNKPDFEPVVEEGTVPLPEDDEPGVLDMEEEEEIAAEAAPEENQDDDDDEDLEIPANLLAYASDDDDKPEEEEDVADLVAEEEPEIEVEEADTAPEPEPEEEAAAVPVAEADEAEVAVADAEEDEQDDLAAAWAAALEEGGDADFDALESQETGEAAKS